jgi:GT2 family glycosyltransferase/glycosyltransferase involved in cell wall biosynthesis
VVDNASDDGSVEYLEGVDFDINIIKNANNETFSFANNQAAKVAKGDYLLFLNNDTEVTTGWLDELIKVAVSNDKAGAVGAKLVYPKEPNKGSKAGKSWRIQHAGIGFVDNRREKMYFTKPYNLGNGNVNFGIDKGYKKQACVAAAVLLVSKKAFDEVGGFDEKYIYGYEDVDLCLKLLHAGYNNYYCSDSLVYHYEFGTQEVDDSEEVKTRRLHNMEVFKGKWQRILFTAMLREKLEVPLCERIYTDAKLTFTFILPKGRAEDFADMDKVVELKKSVVDKGYKAKIHNRDNEEKEYTIGVGTDVLISFDSEYDLNSIKNVKNDLFTYSYDEIAEGGIDKVLSDIKAKLATTVNDKEIDICGAMPDNANTKFWGDYHYALALKNEFEKRGYKANILSKEKWYNVSSAKYVVVLRGVKAYYPAEDEERRYIMWNISHPADVKMYEYDLYNHVFFASKLMQDKLKDKLNVGTGVLPQCTDPEVMTATGNEKKYELLFVGNSRRVYRQILKDVIPPKYKLTVYGRHWEEFPVKDYVVADYIDNNEVGQAYHDAKILLNDHWDDMKEYGIVSNRIFDALSAGAFVISDDVVGMDEMLGGSVVTYKNADDLSEKIDYYMQHEEERNEKAEAGKKLVRAEHTFANRADELIKVMEQL